MKPSNLRFNGAKSPAYASSEALLNSKTTTNHETSRQFVNLGGGETQMTGKSAAAATRLLALGKISDAARNHDIDDEAPLGGVVKRGLDIVISAIALVATAPLMLIIAALIYISMGRPIFFSHERVGFNRSLFRCYKFRSMVSNSQEVLEKHLASDPEAARRWAETRKLMNDPRVTSLGRFLRKSSLDEIPQLFNILKGEMSCVGPRPVVMEELAKYGVSNRDYLATRPGLTGLWQVSGRNNTTYFSRVCLDRIYRRRWSLNLDFLIMFKTIPAVLRFKDTA